MKEIKANCMWNHHSVMEYFICGIDFVVNGEFYFNREKSRYEHNHLCPDGSEILVYWNF